MTDTEKKPSFVKTVVMVIVALIIGVMIGQSGNSSSTKSPDIKQSSSNSKDALVASAEPKAIGKVEVKSHVKKMDRGYTEVVGEVVNNRDMSAESVQVTATFYDKEGSVIGTDFTFAGDTTSTPLEPGLTTPFEISSYPDKFDADHYKLDVTWR